MFNTCFLLLAILGPYSRSTMGTVCLCLTVCITSVPHTVVLGHLLCSFRYPVHVWYDGKAGMMRESIYDGMDETYTVPVSRVFRFTVHVLCWSSTSGQAMVNQNVVHYMRWFDLSLLFLVGHILALPVGVVFANLTHHAVNCIQENCKSLHSVL